MTRCDVAATTGSSTPAPAAAGNPAGDIVGL
jgi:hypothetical protein